MRITPDQLILWHYGFIKLNGTIATTWGVMVLLTVGAHLITRRLTSDVITSRWQAAVEIIVTGIDAQIKEVGLSVPTRYIAFIGTLFIFIATANLLTIVPGYEPPTSSLSTTAALAVCVFVAVAGLWRGAARLAALSALLPRTHHNHAALQSHQRTVAHAGTRRTPVWQHDERHDDHRHSPDDHAVRLSCGNDPARTADRHGAGLLPSILATVYIAAATGDDDL